MARPQKVAVAELQHRPTKARPWIVRWTVDGAPKSRSRSTKAEAEDLRARLLVAARDGERFDTGTGEPVSWHRSSLTVADWIGSWAAEQWPSLEPRSRQSLHEGLERALVLLVYPQASAAPSRGQVRSWLVATASGAGTPDAAVGKWLSRWSLPLADLTRDLCVRAELELWTGETGVRLAPATHSRLRKAIRSCLADAVERGHLPAHPWPPPKRGKRRKACKVQAAVDTRKLPSTGQVVASLDGMVSHQPASKRYRAMTATIYLAGLRPSEVAAMPTEALTLPKSGWGRIDVDDAWVSAGGLWADDDDDDIGEPKTGQRRVPIPPQLVTLLREHLGDRKTGLVWQTRNGNVPTHSNWTRAWHRGRTGPWRLYDLRHAHATEGLRAGVSLGEMAHRLGHSVETLTRVYVGVLTGDEQVANERLGSVFEGM